jgi:hypothetical protein
MCRSDDCRYTEFRGAIWIDWSPGDPEQMDRSAWLLAHPELSVQGFPVEITIIVDIFEIFLNAILLE